MSNATTTHWMPEPDGRGTFRLVISCLATLFLCVYTALHLNVPPKRAGRIWILGHKFGWVLMGMFAPELVVFTAWLQWVSAKKLTEKVNQHLDKQTGSESAEWTMTHSFYAQMGGFVIETDDPKEDPYIPDSLRLHLTAKGAAALAEMGHLPLVSKESILDKSKADGLGKSIVVIQASWLILQCIARVAAHLPLTLLELNTLAHAACALIIYFLWWDKPLDIRDPTVIHGSWCRPVTAALWMFSRTNVRYDPEDISVYSPEIESLLHLEKEQRSVAQNEDPSRGNLITASDVVIEMQPTSHPTKEDTERENTPSNTLIEDPDDRLTKISPYGTESLSPHREMKVTLKRGEILLPFGFGPNPSSQRFKTRGIPEQEPTRWYYPPVEVTVDFTTLTRWRLAQQCLKNYPEMWNRYRKEHKAIEGGWTLHEYPLKLCKDSFVEPVMPNYWSPGLIGVENSHSTFLFAVGCLFVYGGLHAVAWNDYFPTFGERLWWRFSSLFIASSGLLFGLLEAATRWACRIADRPVRSDRRSFVGRLSGTGTLFAALLIVVSGFAIAIGIVAFLVARTFLAVEAFYSLRDLPTAVYQTPSWTQYLSHL